MQYQDKLSGGFLALAAVSTAVLWSGLLAFAFR